MQNGEPYPSHLVKGDEREAFMIDHAGKPVAQVKPVEMTAPRRTGFLNGQFEVPDDFDDMMADEIQAMFEGKYDGSGLYVPPDQRNR